MWPWLSGPVCVLIAVNLFGHYYWVCTIPPGFVTDPPRQPGAGLLWARRRRTARNRAATGVHWSEDVRVTRATVSKCRRCGELRPEVRARFAPFYYLCFSNIVLSEHIIVEYATAACSSMIITVQ